MRIVVLYQPEPASPRKVSGHRIEASEIIGTSNPVATVRRVRNLLCMRKMTGARVCGSVPSEKHGGAIFLTDSMEDFAWQDPVLEVTWRERCSQQMALLITVKESAR